MLYVTAFFLPPLAVYLKQGATTAFGTNLCLTMLGWLPGVVHAVYVLARDKQQQQQRYQHQRQH
ncbi:uncharacterized protein THITE_2044357 [Thermothielavioides terrestris NRRL 8126]|jgi:uncharacterized membrane protein YqaE (UPF0057 family)|uniref:YqaE/Pmp3 family membrane protein n=2 Tax=Thermothielavioides terrestris TaxID=2587410 RepID=G2QZN7_THETT|nr:uncharacterized protein THITE_2044357 [Thermothielavioides terrestris NRRL 8126]AEO66366.1 hypothetical protein THITE_2044357 [Thermothielavioides terrestris NRRL 8126]